uniref:Uncharacterized protein n=1 Tax=viral metagenome TaxID=1070528 RepID=A0A6C0EA86_9ZZZZ
MECIICGKLIEIDYEIHVNECLDKSIEEEKNNTDDGMLTLTECQKKALEYCNKKSKIFEKNTRANVEIKLIEVGFCEDDFVKLKEYIKACEVTINFPSKIINKLIEDKRIKNVFEIQNKKYILIRSEAEDTMFGKKYTDVNPEERVKYGAINILHEKYGIKSTRGYGECIFVLKNKLKKRITFVNGDSYEKQEYICTFDNFMHFFLHSNKDFMEKVLKRINKEDCDYNIPYTEVQIHGDVLINRDIDKLLIPDTFSKSPSIKKFKEAFPDVEIVVFPKWKN